MSGSMRMTLSGTAGIPGVDDTGLDEDGLPARKPVKATMKLKVGGWGFSQPLEGTEAELDIQAARVQAALRNVSTDEIKRLLVIMYGQGKKE